MNSSSSIGSFSHSNITHHDKKNEMSEALEGITSTFVKYIYQGLSQEDQKNIFSAFGIKLEKNTIRIIPQNNVENKVLQKALEVACNLPTEEFIKTIKGYGLEEVKFQYSFTSHLIDLPKCIAAAILKGDLDILGFLLDQALNKRMNLNLSLDERHYTPLMLAIFLDNFACVKYLIDRGADANFADPLGHTALNVACFEGDCQIIEYLLEKGASAQDQKKIAMNPLMAAVVGNHFEIIKYLVEKCKADLFTYIFGQDLSLLSGTLYVKAIATDPDLKIVKYLFQKMKETNEDEKFKTHTEVALIIAAREGNLNILQFLSEQNVNINAVDHNTMALMEAIDHKKIDVIEWLIKQHVNIDVANDDGERFLSHLDESTQKNLIEQM